MKKEITFDITEFPKDIKEYFYKKYSDSSIQNGCYKKYYVHGEQKPRDEYKGGEILFVDKEIDYIVERGDDPISDYFYDQGCKKQQEVLIKIWW